LDIDGGLVIDLIDIIQQETQRFPQIIMGMLNSNPQKEEAKICSSFISLFKGDLSTAKILSQKMGVNQNLAVPVIAAALGNMQILSEFYSQI
jgi:hypothetical protein